ncbi:DUF1028 domain-containing protein [Ornithinimicrobium sp. Y1694]|uniref:DUF1028 domain-containing protein n=1 Tax=Ornithinimicrobium sp. Y1694 TaxID=3418590 RepID=UPI003CF7783A
MTWSITARCPRTGQFGVAVSTCVPAVGSLCPFAQAQIGAVATQSFVNPYLGTRGLQLLADGLSAQEVKEELLTFDPEPALRQFAIVDTQGRSAAFTGDQCDGWAGHHVGDGFVVAGNMLVGQDTITAAVEAFEHASAESLAERLVRALEAGQAAGGDKRGRQSAAVKVVSTEDYPLVDLRVDEHPDPVAELRRVFGVAQEQLFPFLDMLPTRDNPAGHFDLESSRELGILKDS